MTTKQAPINSGFKAESNARDVIGDVRLDGKIAIVTGGYVGVGLETTRALVNAGATVIVPARTIDKARVSLATLESLESIQGEKRVEIDTLDLFDPASIDAFAARFNASNRPLHFLINNAGIMAAPLKRSPHGIESQLATNHLGHFQLTARLWPSLKRANGARVVCLTSRGHRRAGMDFEDPNFERRPYDKWVAYGQSKTANALFALALDARSEAHRVRAFSVHPGAIITDLMRHMTEEERRAAVDAASEGGSSLKTTEQGAATSLWCATSRQLDGMGGVYCEDADIAVALPADSPEPRGVRPWAMDKDAAERLWMKSEAWTGIGFPVD